MRDSRRGTVQPYEGCWKSVTFPVLVDWTGQTLMLAVRDVTVLTSDRKRASGAAATA
jgi:hypothetical protein